ncbi:hypothetical protein Bca4012_065218 [Brassica carinata]|uniref:Polygalacturonase n=1 Tax=Brassica carinata TaxID=52824 RepID=A0A8X7VNS4_BRACI|nr:hypothetical protein Bca52824_017644 [Brassica carinata]
MQHTRNTSGIAKARAAALLTRGSEEESGPSKHKSFFQFDGLWCGGDGVTVNTEAFERAIYAISKLSKKGGGQLNVPPGRWLTAPFNLTSYMTLFLAEDAEILAVQNEKLWPLLPPLPSYGYGREHYGPRYGSFIHGQNLKDVVVTDKVALPAISMISSAAASSASRPKRL